MPGAGRGRHGPIESASDVVVESSLVQDSKNSLEAQVDGVVVFSSRGHWLYPLLELEAFLAGNPIDPASITLHDTKSGRAAAGLTVRLGIRKAVVGLVSDYALDFYAAHGVEVEYKQKVPRINCATENLITPSMGPDEIRSLVLDRIRASGGVQGRPDGRA